MSWQQAPSLGSTKEPQQNGEGFSPSYLAHNTKPATASASAPRAFLLKGNDRHLMDW